MVGVLFSTWPEAFVAPFRQKLSRTGWVDGQNLTIEYRVIEGHYGRLPALAAKARQPQD